jgi:hypothetical protein
MLTTDNTKSTEFTSLQTNISITTIFTKITSSTPTPPC